MNTERNQEGSRILNLVSLSLDHGYASDSHLPDDPLADLLAEYARAEEQDEVRDDELVHETAPDFGVMTERDILTLIRRQLSSLEENSGRMKFYLGEMEHMKAATASVK